VPTATASDRDRLTELIHDKATRLRIHSIRETTAAGSGHPTSCASAAEIVATLFFSVMRYDPRQPASADNDVFILSKGHAAPVLYAAWAEAGAIPIEHLLALRRIDSDLEGHPTPRLPFVPVATGSLGQGLSAGIGMALSAKNIDSTDRRIYVLIGDGESAEGAVWEGAHLAGHYRLDNLCAIIDVNRLGQSEPTIEEHDMEAYRRRWDAFGWHAMVVDGHDVNALLDAFDEAGRTKDRPSIVLARTLKGKGITPWQDKLNYHGKPLSEEEARAAVQALERELSAQPPAWQPKLPKASAAKRSAQAARVAPPYAPGSKPVATRRAFGDALAATGKANADVVAVDGDVKNSTYTEEFQQACPERFFQMYIAEQNMVGAAMGFAAAGKIPFASTFACFFARAYDFVRMAAISQTGIKLVGTHAGVSIGEDGPSQMGLEDLASMCAEPNMTVLYPSDAVSAWRAIELAAMRPGLFYVRTSRPATPILYDAAEPFDIGKAKVLRRGTGDKAVVVGAGITLFEALKAYDRLHAEGLPVTVIDLFSVQPIDTATLRECALAAGGKVVTVEDHYAHGGIGDAVLSALATERVEVHKLAVREIPRSGKPDELLHRFGISADAICDTVRRIAG
jgi:transketolase